MNNNSILIIGAGIAGLTAAYKLAQSGEQVIIIEKECDCGGLARSIKFKDNIFDFGPHRFHTHDAQVSDFINEILAEDKLLIKRNSKVWLFNHYHNWPLDYHSLFKLPYNIMFKAFIDLFNRPKPYNDTFESYVISKYGKTLYKYFFKPYTIKFLNYPPAELHSDWGKIGIDRAVITNEIQMNNLLDVAKSALLPKPVETEFIYPKYNGIQLFCDKLKKKILALNGKIYTSDYPIKIKITDDKILEITTKNNLQFNDCKKIIWTATINDLLDILEIKNIDLEFLSSIFYNIILKNKVNFEYQWCYYGSDDIFFNRISMPHSFSDNNLKKSDNHTLCVELAAKENTAIFNNPDTAIIKITEDLVKAKVINSINEVDDIKIIPIKNTYPIYKKNYRTELNKARKKLAHLKNLVLLGRSAEFWYNNMDHSIKKALDATI